MALVGRIKVADEGGPWHMQSQPTLRDRVEQTRLGHGARAGRLLASGKPGSAMALLVASKLLGDKTAGVVVAAFGDELRRLAVEGGFGSGAPGGAGS
jgi:hypothetical protein